MPSIPTSITEYGAQAALEALQQQRERLASSWSILSLLANAYVEMARFIDDSWPSFLRPAVIDTWLESVKNYSIFITGINDSIKWLDRANQLVLDGSAEYRPSQTVTGDLDLWGHPDDFGPIPGRLLDAFAAAPGESGTLGIAPAVAVLIAVGIVGGTGSIVSVSMAVIEQTKTRRAEIRAKLIATTVAAVNTGAISETFGLRILKTIDVWTKAEAEADKKPLLKIDTGGVLTVAALGGVGYGIYRLLSRKDK